MSVGSSKLERAEGVMEEEREREWEREKGEKKKGENKMSGRSERDGEK